MKNIIAIIVCPLLLVGCSDSKKPLDSGTPISGAVMVHSLRANVGSNAGTDIPKDARVDVYDSIVIIRLSDGSRQVVPHEYISHLQIK